MLPAIGLMVGAYILTRMLELATNKAAHPLAKIFAILTFIVTVVCIIAVLSASRTVGALR